MYKECPQKYKFRYIHMLPEQPKYYFAFGSALHSVMEYVYNPTQLTFPTLAEALVYFEKTWNKTTFEQKGYASVEKELAGYAEGRRIIETYYEKHASTFAHPLSVELKSTLEMDGLSLVSILDRMDYLGDGKIKILDYKTGKTVQREPDQLYMYQKVVETSPLIKSLVQQKDPSVKDIQVAQLSFYHLPTLQEMTFERAPDKEIIEFWQKVLQIADKIRAGEFEPTPSETKCRWCDYKDKCPVWTGKEYMGEGKTPFATAPKVELVKSEQEILAQKIDEYGECLAKSDQLKKEIIELMKKNNFGQHYGSAYKAQLKEEIIKNISTENAVKIVALLRTVGLLENVRQPVKSCVLELLEDNTISAAIKTKLQALITSESATQLSIDKVQY